MEKSFGKLLTDSIITFKKSFLATLGILVICLGIIFVFGVILALMFGKQIFTGGGFPINTANVFVFIPILIAIFFAIMLLNAISYAWMVLVIRNNILMGQSFFKEAFFEAIRKLFKVILFFILLFIIFGVIFFVSHLIYPRLFPILMIPCGAIVFPAIFTSYNGIVCLEGRFWDIISESVSLGFNRWTRIIWYTLCFIFCSLVLLVGITLGIRMIFKPINMIALGSVLMMIVQSCFTLFSYCFYTSFYLDLAGIEPQQKVEMTEEPVIEEDITQDIRQDLGQNVAPNTNQSPIQPNDENQEPPHMEVLK